MEKIKEFRGIQEQHLKNYFACGNLIQKYILEVEEKNKHQYEALKQEIQQYEELKKELQKCKENVKDEIQVLKEAKNEIYQRNQYVMKEEIIKTFDNSPMVKIDTSNLILEI